MSYVPINWQMGDTITAEKLNKMDNGWGFESTQLFSETVITETGAFGASATLSYFGIINSDTLTITFDGTDYSCTRIDAFGGYYYGGFTEQGPDFSEYPFALQSLNRQNMIFTQNAGTYTVAVDAPAVVASANFEKAVKATDLVVVPFTTTWQEVYDALQAGRNCYCLTVTSGAARKDPILHAIQLDNYTVFGISITNEGVTEVFSHTAGSADGVLS